ncbi:hypothetical protein HDV03_001154 [Kappamyces sp. JEL0829]|nr:hypothetical protein HDV03_001154 [Kappamyces sp. JEL0829]KAJ3366282.1 hypothetical protein HDU91_001939 [Kappamyces sp. JEL0680]
MATPSQGREIIMKILLRAGCASATKQVVEELAWLLESFWESISMEAKPLVEANNRTHMTWLDLKHAGMLDDLMEVVLVGDFDRATMHQPRPLDSHPESTGSARKKKKKTSKAISKPYTSFTFPGAILPHFPPFPPEHSHLATKLTLHPTIDQIDLRQKKIEYGKSIDTNLKKIVASHLLLEEKSHSDTPAAQKPDPALKALDYFGFGFCNGAINA